jgi:hypothetical protein
MIPQDTFMVVAEVRPGQLQSLRDLLARMNRSPGIVDPMNKLFPFALFRTLHFARFVIIDDRTLDDLAAYGESFPGAPVWLAFLGDCDGPSSRLLTAFAREAGSGLRAIFRHCLDYDAETDLLTWMRRRSVRPAASYVNCPGRTVRQIKDEAALHAALAQCLEEIPSGEQPTAVHQRLRQAIKDIGPIVGLPAPTPALFWLRQQFYYLLAALALLFAAALVFPTPVILLIPVYLFWLRRLERSDPVIAPRPADEHVRALAALEDHDLVNPFTGFGSGKPGLFRAMTLRFLLFLLHVAARILYGRGRLARIGTIHFARWVFLDGGRRLFFASNYDRSLESYADDFVNKVAFGINLVFGNGIGFPRVRWLILGGAKDERSYRHYLRRHQLPTQVWYNACPGLTAYDINRNTRIREGLQREKMTDAEIRQWLALI